MNNKPSFSKRIKSNSNNKSTTVNPTVVDLKKLQLLTQQIIALEEKIMLLKLQKML
jgi:hypothetical protein